MKFKLFSFVFALFFVLASTNAFAQVAVTPNPAPSNVNLVCGISGANPGTYTYKWFLNNQEQAYTSNTLPSSATLPYQSWMCQMRPNLPGAPGNVLVGSATATITNTPPVATITGYQNGTEGITQINFTGNAVDNVDYDPISAWSWNFGDGNTANTQNSNHVYLNNGTYTVTFTATDSNGGPGSATTTVFIGDQVPNVNFSIIPNTINETSSVNVSDLSTSYDPISSFVWDFGDLTPFINTQNATHAYFANGTYTITLNVTDNDGSLSSFSRTLTVNDLGPFANFTQNLTTINEGQSVQFTDSSLTFADVIISWFWNFGDGNNAFGLNQLHQYMNNGTYLVTLLVTDFDGSTNTAFGNVTVNDLGPFANFSVSSLNVTAGQQVNFTDLSTSFPDTLGNWLWNFGDGNVSNVQNATHIYLINGTYNVNLTVTDSDGTSNVSAIQQILVNPALIVNTAPVVTLVSPLNNTNISISNVSLNYNVVDDLSSTLSCSLTLNGLVNSTNPSVANGTTDAFNLTLADGPYTWLVICNDGLLNGTSQVFAFNVNTTLPAVHDVLIQNQPIASNGTGIRINDSVDILSIPANLNQGTNYTIRVISQNVGTVSEAFNTTINIFNQTGSLIITFVNNHNIGAGSPTTDSYNWDTTGLTAGTYTITANASTTVNPDSNTSNNFVSRLVNMNVPFAPDTIPPASVSNLIVTSFTNQSVTWNWTNPLNPDFNGTILFLNGNNIINLTSVANTYTASNLSNNTLYNLSIQTFDNATPRNVNTTLVQSSQLTLGNNDTIPPGTVINLTNGTITNSSIMWNWINPANPDFANVIVLLNGNNVLNTTLGTYTANNLTNNTAYTIVLHTIDGNGNINLTNINNTKTTLQNPAQPNATIINSTINGTFYAATNSLWTNIDNSPIRSSTLSGVTNFTLDIKIITSNILNSSITNSYLTTVTATNSTIINSDLTNSNILRCLVKNIFGTGISCTDSVLDPPLASNNLTGSTFINSSTFNSNVTNSMVINSNITNSNVDQSTLNRATITSATIQSSTITNSTISNGVITSSNLTNVQSSNSNVTGSVITSSTLTNSSITNTNLVNVTVLNAIIVNGNITNNGTIILPNGINVTGPAPVPRAPTVSSISTNPGNPVIGVPVTFFSNAADVNGNIVSYNWTTTLGPSTLQNPTFTYNTQGTYPVTITVTDSTGLNATYSRNVVIASPASPTSGGGGGSGSFSTVPPINQELLIIARTIKWDMSKDGNPFTKTMRPIDSIIFDYNGTSYSLMVDEFTKDGKVTLKISPTGEKKTGYKGDEFDFTIKDKTLIVTIEEIVYNDKIESQSTIKFRLNFMQGKPQKETLTEAVSKAKDGVIKVIGEITPPPETIPVGIGISAATVIVGLLLFLGMRKIWN